MAGTAEPTSPTIVPFDDRARRVIELREQVRAGAYRPDPREVARAILAHTGDGEHSEHPEHGESETPVGLTPVYGSYTMALVFVDALDAPGRPRRRLAAPLTPVHR
jgi:hypothetical protein